MPKIGTLDLSSGNEAMRGAIVEPSDPACGVERPDDPRKVNIGVCCDYWIEAGGPICVLIQRYRDAQGEACHAKASSDGHRVKTLRCRDPGPFDVHPLFTGSSQYDASDRPKALEYLGVHRTHLIELVLSMPARSGDKSSRGQAGRSRLETSLLQNDCQRICTTCTTAIELHVAQPSLLQSRHTCTNRAAPCFEWADHAVNACVSKHETRRT